MSKDKKRQREKDIEKEWMWWQGTHKVRVNAYKEDGKGENSGCVEGIDVVKINFRGFKFQLVWEKLISESHHHLNGYFP